MAKIEPTKTADGATSGAAEAPVTAAVDAQERPRLGTLVRVRVPDGLQLVNNETGQLFAPGQATDQTVTTTTLRRLDDGDLVLA